MLPQHITLPLVHERDRHPEIVLVPLRQIMFHALFLGMLLGVGSLQFMTLEIIVIFLEDLRL